jgi:uncharacterized protein (DUF488 family)
VEAANNSEIFTIGHSTVSAADFLTMLGAWQIRAIVDVRTVPRSRHNPQFNKETLPASLAAAAIEYTHMPGLGGLRKPKVDSPNGAWKNASFRGFADYMQTEEFAESLERLVALARTKRAAIMCAEAVPWRCHRSLIADALLARGFRVQHIMSAAAVKEHVLTAWAKTEGHRVWYPGGAE